MRFGKEFYLSIMVWLVNIVIWKKGKISLQIQYIFQNKTKTIIHRLKVFIVQNLELYVCNFTVLCLYFHQSICNSLRTWRNLDMIPPGINMYNCIWNDNIACEEGHFTTIKWGLFMQHHLQFKSLNILSKEWTQLHFLNFIFSQA